MPTSPPDVLCTLHVGARSGLSVIGGVVAEAAEALGVPGGERAQLRAVTELVIEAIAADSFVMEAAVDVDVAVERRAGGIAVVISDRGAPSSLSRGTYPPKIAALIRLGFADDLSARSLGREGNRTEITKRLHYRAVVEDEGFAVDADATVVPELDDAGQPLLDVRPMTEADVFEVARLFYRTYGYSAYYAPAVYEPDLLAELVRSGQHIGTVAVTGDGRVVGHVATTARHSDDVTGSLGLLAVDPAYRSLGLTARLALPHVVRLVELGFIGQYSYAVTVHERSQRLGLRSGAHEVGLLLALQDSSVEFVGFDVDTSLRHASMLMFGSLGAIPERAVHVPATYADIAASIYASCGLPRTLVGSSPRRPEGMPPHTRFRVQMSGEGAFAMLDVEEFGEDFDSALQAQMTHLWINRYQVVLLNLPLNDPATAFYGDGLHALGLFFGGIYPEYHEGDMLVLQVLNDVAFNPEAIATASENGAALVRFVVDDHRRVTEFTARQQRSQAAVARVLGAID